MSFVTSSGQTYFAEEEEQGTILQADNGNDYIIVLLNGNKTWKCLSDEQLSEQEKESPWELIYLQRSVAALPQKKRGRPKIIYKK